jgi:hypothetical protein
LRRFHSALGKDCRKNRQQSKRKNLKPRGWHRYDSYKRRDIGRELHLMPNAAPQTRALCLAFAELRLATPRLP